jgi:UDP-N-acetyl-D-mannosaminuronic acid transferase (WecB/TagA/CpsF family)
MNIETNLNIKAGTTAHTPQWMDEAGLEWLFALLNRAQQRWNRYSTDSHGSP